MEQCIKIESVISNLNRIEDFLNDKLKELHIVRKIYCRMYLATTEAVTNAIIHGNKADRCKQVTVSLNETAEYYQVKIQDEGFGFDYNNLPDPRDPENILKESGRGIFIMRQYADQVSFSNNGSKVILKFNK